MDDFISQFFTVNVIVFSLVIWVAVWVLRKVIELYFKKITSYESWRELFLPVLPVVVGGLLAVVAKQYPFPELFAKSVSSRMFLGIVCGMFSGFVYKLIKKNFVEKLTAKKEDEKTAEVPAKEDSGTAPSILDDNQEK